MNWSFGRVILVFRLRALQLGQKDPAMHLNQHICLANKDKARQSQVIAGYGATIAKGLMPTASFLQNFLVGSTNAAIFEAERLNFCTTINIAQIH